MTQAPARSRSAAFPAPAARPDAELQLSAAEALSACGPGFVAAFSTAYPAASDVALCEAAGDALRRAHGRAGPPPVILAQHHSALLLDLAAGGEDGRGPDAVAGTFGARGESLLHYDGVMAGVERPALLLVKTADCVPVLALDPERGTYAALHAGWRGAAAGILPGLLRRWREAGSTLRAVRLALGPHIGVCCYEVGPECVRAFPPEVLAGAVHDGARRPHLSLAAVLRNQARAHGVAAAHIDVHPHCTQCHRAPDGTHPYASYRRDSARAPGQVGTNLALIGPAQDPAPPAR